MHEKKKLQTQQKLYERIYEEVSVNSIGPSVCIKSALQIEHDPYIRLRDCDVSQANNHRHHVNMFRSNNTCVFYVFFSWLHIVFFGVIVNIE